MKLDGKKLLILGANAESIPLVLTAKKLGVYTIVTDYNPDAPAKEYADKACNVDGIDVDGLVKLAQDEKVDGVLVSVADMLIPTYQKVCEKLNLPCYATEEQVKVLVNKYNFKRTCEKYGILGIPEYDLDINDSDEKISKLPFPVLIKPVDSCSGKGMTVCYDSSSVRQAMEKASKASPTNKFIAERYMTCDDAFMYYTFIDGKYYLSAMADRFTNHEQSGLSNVVIGAVYPSKYLDHYYKEYHEKFCKMFSDLGIRNGVFLVQVFVENGKMFVYDPGFRLQGGAPHILVNAINGFDHREMLINLALTGSMGDYEMDKLNDSNFRGKKAASIVFLLKKGFIGKISGMDEINKLPEVVSVNQRLYEGDEVYNIGTEQQVFVRIHAVADDAEKLREVMVKLKNTIKVYDTEGNDMLLTTLDENIIK